MSTIGAAFAVVDALAVAGLMNEQAAAASATVTIESAAARHARARLERLGSG
jgi:hypothetical protein